MVGLCFFRCLYFLHVFALEFCSGIYLCVCFLSSYFVFCIGILRLVGLCLFLCLYFLHVFHSWVLQWEFAFCGLHWYFEVYFGILRITLVFWGLYWYFQGGWLRADMVGLCLFPLTINCRPTAMQCSHRQKRGSIVFCNFVFLYFCFVNCFSGIRYLNQPWYELKNEYAKSIKLLYF